MQQVGMSKDEALAGKSALTGATSRDIPFVLCFLKNDTGIIQISQQFMIGEKGRKVWDSWGRWKRLCCEIPLGSPVRHSVSCETTLPHWELHLSTVYNTTDYIHSRLPSKNGPSSNNNTNTISMFDNYYIFVQIVFLNKTITFEFNYFGKIAWR